MRKHRARSTASTIAIVAALGGIAAFRATACKPVKIPGLVCSTADDAYTRETRLAAMLSVHAYAYYPESMTASGKGPEDILVQPLRDAIGTLRCDPDPLAVSRRRRAIAKLLAYDWPGKRYRKALEALGADVDAIVGDIQSQLKHARVHQYLRRDRSILEMLILRVTARKPFLLKGFSTMFIPSSVTPTVTSTLPTLTSTVTPTPHFVPPPMVTTTATVTATPTPPGIIMAPTVKNLCAEQWMPEEDYFSNNTEGVTNAHAYISVPGSVRREVAVNVDPQSWDECSKFWPRPAIAGNPSDSASLASVTPSGCTVPFPSGIVLSAVTAGSAYPAHDFYEHFRCVASGCDSEFKNILRVDTTLTNRTIGNSTVPLYRVHYSLPICIAGQPTTFDGAMFGRVQTTSVVATVDEGHIEVWEEGARTHVEARKHVSFSNKTWSNSLSALLEYSELNEELSEIACCKKAP